MANFAVLDGENVINTIVADSKAIAEEVTGKTCVEFSATDYAEINGLYKNNTFISKKPYPSWTLNENNIWISPVLYPEDGAEYVWDEETGSWTQ